MKNHIKLKRFIDVVSSYESIKFDYSKISKEELDLNNGRNTNVFPYRGQFSPDLVKGLLKYYSLKNSVVLDPFVGCGTTLFEAAKRQLPAYGVEINPAAFDMAKTSIFMSLDKKQRRKYINTAIALAERDTLFSATSVSNIFDIKDYVEKLIFTNTDKYIDNILKNAYLRFLNSKSYKSLDGYIKAVNQHGQIIENLPDSRLIYEVFNTDARSIPLDQNTIDLIITSPPYVNVFNYHQHNRVYIDNIYGNALHVAKSEFGANRKFRQNRLLTVVQYILDMTVTFLELKRVLKDNGRIILIIGKTTKVRGINFRNDYMIALVSYLTDFTLVTKQERKFLNQFGQTIYEEVLHFRKHSSTQGHSINEATKLVKELLVYYKQYIQNENIIHELNEAISKSDIINQSVKYKVLIDENPAFRKNKSSAIQPAVP